MGFFDDPFEGITDFFSNPINAIFPVFGLANMGLSGMFGSKKNTLDLPVMPNPPSASDAAVKAAKMLARKRAASQQGMEDTILTGSLGIAPGLKATLG